MPLYKFKSNDVFVNRVKVNPKQTFIINDQKVILNEDYPESGSFADPIKNVPVGNVSLYELNIDRPANQLIYPFIYKSGDRIGFKSVTTSKFNKNYAWGATITSSYPLSASISKLYFGLSSARKRIQALKNTFNFYTPLSPAYQYTSDYWSKGTQELGLLSIPSILYGSSIKKGTVDLRFYVTGTLIGQLKDTRKNGEMIEVSGTNVGACAGVVLYNEGFIALTGSWALSPPYTEAYTPAGATTPKWTYFAQSISGTITANSSSFVMSYEGQDYVSTITMLAHAKKGEVNHSNNPTFPKRNLNREYFSTGTYGYSEPDNTALTNLVSSSFLGHTASFEKITYISEIGVFDKDKNLIGIAKLATPVKKTEERDFTFKLKLDI
tara:strand:- start:196 stop:1338 length:1143 start_codon:yes stop_codon:yes gene_type:complete